MSRVQRPAHRSTTPLRLIFVEERRARCGRDEKCARSGGGRDNGDRSPPATQSEIADEQGRQMKTRSIKMSSHFFFFSLLSPSFFFPFLPPPRWAREILDPCRGRRISFSIRFVLQSLCCCCCCYVPLPRVNGFFFFMKNCSRKFFSW